MHGKTMQFPTSSGGIMKAKDHIRIARTLAGTYKLKGRKKSAFILGGFGIIGAALGALLATAVRGEVLRTFFGIFLAYFGRELYNKANLET